MKKIKILSFDGGGPFSLINLVLLKRMLEMENSLFSNIDVLAGNSGGAISALFLAKSELSYVSARNTLDKLIKFWMDDFLKLPINSLLGDMEALMGNNSLASKRTRLLRDYLTEHFFEDQCLKDLKQKVAITSFKLDSHQGVEMEEIDDDDIKLTPFRSWTPKVYHNFHSLAEHTGHACEHQGHSASVVDIAMASGCPPIGSSIYKGHVDGALFANNPSMCALALVINSERQNDKSRHRSDLLKDIVLFSLGTGQNPKYIETNEVFTDWGYRQWMFDLKHPLVLLQAFYESIMMAVDYQCSHLLGEKQYVRLNPKLKTVVHQMMKHDRQTAMALETAANVPDRKLRIYLEKLKDAGWFE